MLSSRLMPGREQRGAIPSHPLCPDFAWLFNGGGANGALVTSDLVQGRRPATAVLNTSTLTGGSTRFGAAIGFAGTPTNLDYLNLGEASLIGSSVTIVIASFKTDATLRASLGFCIETGGDDNKRCQSHMPYSDGTVYWDFGGAAEPGGRLSVGGLTFGDDIWIFTAGARGREIWQNGFLRASSGDTTGRTTSTADLHLGPMGSGSSPTNDLALYSLFYVYLYQLQPTQCVALSLRPFDWVLQGMRPDALRKTAASGTTFTQSVSDTLTLSEGLVLLTGKGVSDTLTLSEALGKLTGKGVTDVLNLGETLGRQTAHFMAEGLTLSEALTKSTAKAISDGLTLSEALSATKVVLKSLPGETLTLSEVLGRQVGKSLQETLGLSEAEHAAVSHFLAETLTLTETERAQVTKGFAETLGLAETLQAVKLTIATLTTVRLLTVAALQPALRTVAALQPYLDDVTVQPGS